MTRPQTDAPRRIVTNLGRVRLVTPDGYPLPGMTVVGVVESLACVAGQRHQSGRPITAVVEGRDMDGDHYVYELRKLP